MQDVCQGHPTTVSLAPKYIDKTFWLSKALLDLYKCILSGAIKIFIFSIIPGERESFQITRASVCYFPENFKSDLTYNESYNFSDYPPHHILDPKL